MLDIFWKNNNNISVSNNSISRCYLLNIRNFSLKLKTDFPLKQVKFLVKFFVWRFSNRKIKRSIGFIQATWKREGMDWRPMVLIALFWIHRCNMMMENSVLYFIYTKWLIWLLFMWRLFTDFSYPIQYWSALISIVCYFLLKNFKRNVFMEWF